MPSAACWGWLSLLLQPGHLQMAGDVPMGGRRPQEDEDVEDVSSPSAARQRGEVEGREQGV